MKKFFEKNEFVLCMALIALYLIVNSFCMQNFGLTDWRSALVNTLFSAVLVVLTVFLGKIRDCGLVKPKSSPLYFIPLALIASVNLWGGIHIQNSWEQILWHIITMLNVGFIEEVIFRGFLFRMMEKDNLKSAILVSAITFGIGHIINLLNGADVIPTLLQICYAASIGFLFAVILHKTGSLIPCIVTHCAINSLSIFRYEDQVLSYVTAAFLIVVPLVYGIYIYKQKETAPT